MKNKALSLLIALCMVISLFPAAAAAEKAVPADSFYCDPVLWAVEQGITNGVSATAFGPNSPCNRAQVVTFLYRAYV